MTKRSLIALLLALPLALTAQGSLPTPASSLGFEPGADYKLATYDQTVDYFKKLASASKYIQLVEAGKTTQGRTFVFALISTPANLAKIDRYREIAQRLAHPEGLTDEQARALAREGKAFVHIDGGLHATESAGPQHTPLLAYDILRRVNDPDMKTTLENVVLMLWPTINPDGQQMVAEWEMKNVGTPYEGSGLPELYQEYVGHDNNRDAYMLDMIESRVLEHVWRQWEPQIIHVHHQGAPAPSRIWFPPFAEPIATHAPAIMSRSVNMIGMAMAKAEDESGRPGTTHMGTGYDAWYPGYIDYFPMFQNVVAYWTETAASSPIPRPAGGGGGGRGSGAVGRPESLYSSPWPGGAWSQRQAVEYMEVASLAVIDYAGRYKDSVLYDRYLSGRDQIAKGRKEAPYAYVIPQEQRDPVAAVEMLRRLAFSGVRVSQTTAPVTLQDETFPTGTWVIPTDQEFAAVVREVLDVQKYPEIRESPGGPLDQPYDAAGWTLPMQMGVKVVSVGTPIADDVRAKFKVIGPIVDPKLKPTPYNLTTSPDLALFDSAPGVGFNTNSAAAAIVPPAGAITGSGPALAVDPAENNAFRALNRAWKQGATVQFLAGAPGSGIGARYLISGLSEAAQGDLVKSFALRAQRGPAAGVPMKKPRIGIYSAWGGSMDEGWTRWVLEQFDFDLVRLRPADFHSPLRDKVDVVILASDARLGGGGRAGGPPRAGGPGAGAAAGGGAGAAGTAGAGAAPPAAAPPQGRAGGGGRGTRPEYDNTISAEDLKAFEAFVRAGGTVVCLNGASNFAISQFQLPVKNVLTGVNRNEFSMNGSIAEIVVDPSHQLMAGMPQKAAVFVDSSPAFEPQVGFKGAVLASYAPTGSPLLSGFLLGEKFVQGKAAALDVQLDAGHVVLIGFRPQWRGQPFGTFRVLFNAAISVR